MLLTDSSSPSQPVTPHSFSRMLHPSSLPRAKSPSVSLLPSPPSQKHFSAPLLWQRRAKPDGTMRLKSVADRSGARACSNAAIPTDPLCFPFLWSAHNWRQICKQAPKQANWQPDFLPSPHSHGQSLGAGFYLGAVTSACKVTTQPQNGNYMGLGGGQEEQ